MQVIYIRHFSQVVENWISYTVAGQIVCSDSPLAPLYLLQSSTQKHDNVNEPPPTLTVEQLLYDEQAWIGHKWRNVRCWSAQEGYVVDVADVACYEVTSNSIVISRRYTTKEKLLNETTLGIAFILSLAIRHTYCLHASAVAISDHAVLFTGESGRGKSTIAEWLKTQKGLSLLSDDILPISFRNQLYAFPHYPQFKLRPDNQLTHSIPHQIPVAAIICIGKPASTISIRSLSSVESTLLLLRHTVAVRLFDKPLLEQLLQTWAASSVEVPIIQLEYPRDLTQLERVFEKVLTIV